MFISEDSGNTINIKPYYDFLFSIYLFVIGTFEMNAVLGKGMILVLFLTMDQKDWFLAHAICLGDWSNLTHFFQGSLVGL